ncbi:interferon gamma receptor 2 [Gracilinanus agilis]|uniref:interferon gamma receptor 2 n=1 Tax=Gracilinanus agilis TaxID=191870 RepID=UPI001CFCAC16|nr:interferon gamma receptor 2 [Gracilinanus agilis]
MQSRSGGAGWAASHLLHLILLCSCCCLSFSLPLAGSFTQLPIPHNQRIHLYNLEQVLSWDPVPISKLTSPVLYSVEYHYTRSNWTKEANCTRIAEPICNFTAVSQPHFQPHFNVTLRVRAELGELVSDWAVTPWFQHYLNATIGPPSDVIVTPHDDSLKIRFKPPFRADSGKFQYYVHYWENDGKPMVQGPFNSQSIHLKDLKVPGKYCLQVQAELIPDYVMSPRKGLLSNISCHETSAKALTEVQQTLIIISVFFTSLPFLVLGCYFVAQKFQGPIKHFFHPPPGIPPQIKEYLSDPDQPILEALDKKCSPEERWDSLSVVSCQ